jgi:4-hydroxythreonine-4-phosphate dehydrogenase
MPLNSNRPLAISMGCPVGVGPEIILRFFEQLTHEAPVVVGDLGVLQRTAAQIQSPVRPCVWQPGQVPAAGTVPVLEVSPLDAAHLHWGQPTQASAQAMAAYIRRAVQACLSGEFAALVTCPISKKALHKAGILYPGHTEMLAELTGCQRFRMMLAGPCLRVVLVSIHEALVTACTGLNVAAIHDCIAMTAEGLIQDFALSQPRIAVAGLNPHSGEQGMFGHEEQEIIEPALRSYTGPGRISGPWPPDTVFYRASQGDFDAVVSMYHDQGLIPFKLLHFKDGVNVTLGLPIVRTSVDHGTAYDIAGQGKADASSLQAACRLALTIAQNRKNHAVRTSLSL